MFRAALDDKRLAFDTGGVRGGNELFRDRATGSSWQQSTTEAIAGPLKGRHLALYPFLLTTWGEWRREHPATMVLQPLPGYADRVAQMNQVIDRGVLASAPAPKGALSEDARLPAHTPVLGLDLNGAAVAYPMPALQAARVVNGTQGGEAVLIVHQGGTDTTTAFEGAWRGQKLDFRPANAANTQLEDLQTHNAYGVCIAGRLKGAQLPALILEPEFWFAWSEFHPGTGIYTAKPAR